ncbi:hypothetical protein [Streptomyces kanasensis]|uniref:hypothetical protein n=1 Tax=Streptomyces kanasensis TaxID=936756 RepID=UPI0037FA26B3
MQNEVVTVMRLAKGSRWGAALLVLGLLSGTCDDAESGEAEKRLVTSGEVCEGIFRGEAAEVLEQTAATREFFPFGHGSGITETAEFIRRSYVPGGVAPASSVSEDLCLVYRSESTMPDIEISFSLGEGRGGADDEVDLVRYELGRKALAGTGKSLLYSECVSRKLDGSSEHPALLRGQLTRDFRSPTPAEETREANLRLLAAATRALAKSLQCKNSADVPESPTLQQSP